MTLTARRAAVHEAILHAYWPPCIYQGAAQLTFHVP